MNTRTVSRAALAIVGAVGVSASLVACGQVASVDVGSCVNSSDLSGEITDIPTVDCSDEHDGQVFHTFDLDDGDFPGQDDVDAQAEDGCISGFEDFVGTSFEDSSLAVKYITPSEDTWNDANDREIICAAFTSDGSTVTESFEDSDM